MKMLYETPRDWHSQDIDLENAQTKKIQDYPYPIVSSQTFELNAF